MMSREKIQFDQLRKEELCYEASIRGHTDVQHVELDSLAARVREAALNDNQASVWKIPDVDPNFMSTTASILVGHLEGNFKELNEEFSDKRYRRLASRVSHYINRFKDYSQLKLNSDSVATNSLLLFR